MLIPVRQNIFKKDLKRVEKRGKNLDKLKTVLVKLLNEEELEPKYKDHQLIGNYVNTRECHIEPDWLLIYRIEDDCLYLIRTGSHSDLFK